MKIRAWWKQSSGLAKTVTILSALLLLQIGVCALTPTVLPWYEAVFQVPPSHDPLEALGLMAFQAILCVCSLVILFFAWVAFTSRSKRRKIDSPEDPND
jgi:hypothetical protein